MTNSKIPEEIQKSGAFQYAESVISKKIVSGKKRVQACRRFIDDLERSYTEKDYPWQFDLEKGYRPIRFIEQFLMPTKGNYTKMELLPWQHFVEANLYGWVSKNTGYKFASTKCCQGKSSILV